MLEKKVVSRKMKDYKEIKKFMKSVFLDEELFSMWLLLFMSRRDMVDFVSYYDEDEFIGLSYVVNSEEMAFILYLAVNEKFQSMGYGSEILELIKDEYKDKEIVLNVEPIKENSLDYEKREKRYNFYLKNGFIDTGCYVDDDSKYMVLSNREELNKDEYKKLVKKYEPREDKVHNTIYAFLIGGTVGFIVEGLIIVIMNMFNLSRMVATTWTSLIVIFASSLFTALGFFDNWMTKAKAGLLLPTTGFAHSVSSAALDYKKEGLITGLGSNFFKLAGSVILFGILSAFILVMVKVIIGG